MTGIIQTGIFVNQRFRPKVLQPGVQSAIQIEDPGKASVLHQGTGPYASPAGTAVYKVGLFGVQVLDLFPEIRRQIIDIDSSRNFTLSDFLRLSAIDQYAVRLVGNSYVKFFRCEVIQLAFEQFPAAYFLSFFHRTFPKIGPE